MSTEYHRAAAEAFSTRAEDCLADAEEAHRTRDRKHLMRRAAVYAHLALAHSNLAATDALIEDIKKPSTAEPVEGQTPTTRKDTGAMTTVQDATDKATALAADARRKQRRVARQIVELLDLDLPLARFSTSPIYPAELRIATDSYSSSPEVARTAFNQWAQLLGIDTYEELDQGGHIDLRGKGTYDGTPVDLVGWVPSEAKTTRRTVTL